MDTPILIERLPPQEPLASRVLELPMTSEDRRRVRRRLSAPDGRAFALALPTGTTLRVGVLLHRVGETAYVVAAAPEDVLVVRPGGVAEAARAGHLIGNLHRDVEIAGDDLVTLWSAPLEARLHKLGFEVARERRPFLGNPPSEHAHGLGGDLDRAFEGRLDALLPPRYQGSAAVSPEPMGSAALLYDDAGRVAWDRLWGSFCDLALAGGPTHRGTLLEPPTAEEVRAEPARYEAVIAEIERGVRLVTGLQTFRSASLGWVGVRCESEAMAVWLLRAIIVENVAVRRQREALLLPAGPSYRLEKEVKNVITVIAKTHHYWSEHLTAGGA